MVVLHPGAERHKAALCDPANVADARAAVEKGLQLGVLGGECESVDPGLEFGVAAWGGEGGNGCPGRGKGFAGQEDYSA